MTRNVCNVPSSASSISSSSPILLTFQSSSHGISERMSTTMTVMLSRPPAFSAACTSMSAAICGSAYAAAISASCSRPICACSPSEQMMNRPSARAAYQSGWMPAGAPTHCVMMLRGMQRLASSGSICPESMAFCRSEWSRVMHVSESASHAPLPSARIWYVRESPTLTM